MLSKAKIKYIHSLEQKKNRKTEGCFVAEGPKVVGDMLPHFSPVLIVATQEWIDGNAPLAERYAAIIETATDEELRKASFLMHPQQVLAVFRMGEQKEWNANGLMLALDGVQDPGNLGTIIRIADWFGIEDIVCSADTADAYNPKVVQATMGSLARVRMHYTKLTDWLQNLPAGTPVYGTFLDGDDITATPLEKAETAVIVMGNEGNGISDDVEKCVSHRILIPNYPKGRETADSLNVAVATAITCYHMRANN